MKKLLLLLLILEVAVAGSAVTKEEFNFDYPTELKPPLSKIVIVVTSESEMDIYNFTINFSHVPEGITLKDSARKNVKWIRGQNPTNFEWEVEPISELIKVDLTDSFDITWDDKIELYDLRVDNRPIGESVINVTNQEVIITGKTDPQNDSFCNEFDCKPTIYIETDEHGKEIKATKEGTFSSNTELKKGQNKITVTATDIGGNTESTSFKINYTPTTTDILEGNLIWIVVGISFIVTIIILFMIARLINSIKQKGSKYEKMKERRKEIKERLAKIEQKAAYLGMNEDQKAKKEALEIEFSTITETLNKDPRFQNELTTRAKKAVKQAKQGTPSEEIRDQLSEEGYTQKEIDQIKQKFKKLKG